MVGLFAVGTNAFVIAGLLPRIADGLGASQASVSYTITIYAVLVAVASPAVAIVLARVSRAGLMASGALLFTVGVVVAALSTSLTWFVIARVIAAFGGAALVPTASAVAATIVAPERRGRALAFVGAGFTLAVAIGSPLGTALGSAAGWRAPMWLLVGIGALVTVLIPVAFRGMPRPAPVSLRARVRPLSDLRVIAALGGVLFATASFNIVYIFSAQVLHRATGGSGTLLAVLLLVYGGAGVLGNVFAGRITDRYGSRASAAVALIVQAVALVAVAFFEWSYPLCLLLFVVWGVVVAGLTIPMQHRLVSIDPANAQQTMAWFSTAMYLGIAIAPPLGNAAIGLGGPWLVPIAGAVVSVLALGLFLLGFATRRMSAVATHGIPTTVEP
ncbi:MFS transporter [Humibacter ginsenosidimutans]|nr:MFS transporter [Humibacter ginsenosidimutans]